MPIKTQWDMDNAWLAGKSKFESWQKRYDQESTKEMRETIMTLSAKELMKMPDTVKQFYEANMPKEWRAVQKMAETKRKGR